MRRVIPTTSSLVVGPAQEPLTLDLVKLQRRVSTAGLDPLFQLWIAAARQHFEDYTGRQIITATWELWLDAWPDGRVIELPRPPLQAVLSVTYDDPAGLPVVLDPATYRVVAPSGDHARPGRLELAWSASWPTLASQVQAVRVQYRAGYGDTPDAVPPLIRSSLLWLVGHLHKYGEEVQETQTTLSRLPLGAKLMLDNYKDSARLTIPCTTWVLDDPLTWLD